MNQEKSEIRPNIEEFSRAAAEFNIIPLSREFRADFETPLSIFLKCRGEFLLESIERGEHVGRYSFIACGKKCRMTLRGRSLEIRHKNSTPGKNLDLETDNPLLEIREYFKQLRSPEYEHLPPFFGGAIGFLGYEAVQYFEKIKAEPQQDDLPDGLLVIPELLLVYDSVRRSICIIALADGGEDAHVEYEKACRLIEKYEKMLAAPLPRGNTPGKAKIKEMKAAVNREEFKQGVARCLDYIRAGEIIQVVLSQSFSTPLEADPFSVYQALRAENPSPYLFYLDFGSFILVGSSPEIMVKAQGKDLITKPIAGTRPRGATISEDSSLARELLADTKERAEHIMLVDLARNDLGRVAVPGSIEVVDFMSIERYSHVMHLVSTVKGELAPDRDVFDLIRAVFPAGTLSGAPKVRAMEIIGEIEGRRRGPYGGMVFYLGLNGSFDSCITIRTILVKDGQAFIQAGAGIVESSDPEREYQETLQKARALFQAINTAHGGQ